MIAILTRELLPLLRSRKAFVFFIVALMAAGAAFFIRFQEVHGQVSQYGQEGRAFMARSLFNGTVRVLVLAFGIIAPLLTASVVTIERENRTLDLLRCTPLQPSTILLGKWLAVIGFIGILFLCFIPIFILIFTLGGVSRSEFISAGIILSLTVITYSMIGLAVSCWTRRSVPALVLTLFIVLFLIALVPFSLELIGNVFHIPLLRDLRDPSFQGVSGYLFWCVSSLNAFDRFFRRQGCIGMGRKLCSLDCLFSAFADWWENDL